MIDRAIAFATKVHSGVVRKGSKVPYILHPLDVGKIVATMTEDEEIISAAILHDTLEDCEEVGEADIRGEFGDRVARLVKGESENKRPWMNPHDSWEIRKRETIESLEHASEEVKMIAVADKLSNLRDMVIEEERLGSALWEKFNQTDKSKHAWYYGEILKCTVSLSDQFAWRELKRYYNILFGGEHDEI